MVAEQKLLSHLYSIPALFNQHGNCTMVTVDTVVLGKFQAFCISKNTVELTTFLPCILTNKTEYNGVADVIGPVMSTQLFY